MDSLARYSVMAPYGQVCLTATTSAGFVIKIFNVQWRVMLNYHTTQNGATRELNDTFGFQIS